MVSSGGRGYAVNEALELHADLRAVGGWRGPLATQRSSAEFKVVSQVIEAGVELAMEVRMQPDVPCEQWMVGDRALVARLGEGEDEQAQAITKLTAACLRAVEAQPTLVQVSMSMSISISMSMSMSMSMPKGSRGSADLGAGVHVHVHVQGHA